LYVYRWRTSGESGAAGLGGLLAILKESKIKSIKEDLKINNSTNILFINSEGDTDKEVFSEIINKARKSSWDN